VEVYRDPRPAKVSRALSWGIPVQEGIHQQIYDLAGTHTAHLYNKGVLSTKAHEQHVGRYNQASDSQSMVSYLFRKPKFPILCNVDGFIIAAKSEKSFRRQINVMDVRPDKFYDVVDVSGEGWVFYATHMVISPLTVKKRWFKKEVIALYNNRESSSRQNERYSEKSISSKRFDEIFRDIVNLLERA
jgi:hypothetical protein